MFTKAALLSVLATIATAAPTTRAASDVIKFEALSAHSTSVVHLRTITANNHRFYAGGFSSAGCPTDQCPAIDCSKYTNATIFSIDTSTNHLGLDAEVPGGQIVWVEPTGELAYSVAGNAAIGGGVSLGPFTYTPPASNGQVGSLQYNGQNFEACLDSNGDYQVFASGAAGYVPASGCISIDIITSVWTGADAYQYN